MAENLVPTTKTTPSKLDFAEALLAAWPGATKKGAGVLWAHFAGETGDGAYCWNWNLGNVKHVKGDGRDYVALHGVWEGFPAASAQSHIASGWWQADPSPDHAKAVGPGKVSLIATPNNPATWFCAYPSLADGMAAFVNAKRDPTRRYASAWAFVLAGDPEGYARELGRLGYYSASPDVYAAAMRAKFDQWMASVAFDDAEATAPGMQVPTMPPSVNDPNHIDSSAFSLVEVECAGVTWLVSPTYIAPIGIGEAVNLARMLGYELPTPALVDAIWRAADMKIPPDLIVRKTDGVRMDTPELEAGDAAAIAHFIGNRGLGVDYHLAAGCFKDIVVGPDGRIGLYGWHADSMAMLRLQEAGVPTHAPETPGAGAVIQQPFFGHSLDYRDYSQGLRLVKRK